MLYEDFNEVYLYQENIRKSTQSSLQVSASEEMNTMSASLSLTLK